MPIYLVRNLVTYKAGGGDAPLDVRELDCPGKIYGSSSRAGVMVLRPEVSSDIIVRAEDGD